MPILLPYELEESFEESIHFLSLFVLESILVIRSTSMILITVTYFQFILQLLERISTEIDMERANFRAYVDIL